MHCALGSQGGPHFNSWVNVPADSGGRETGCPFLCAGRPWGGSHLSTEEDASFLWGVAGSCRHLGTQGASQPSFSFGRGARPPFWPAPREHCVRELWKAVRPAGPRAAPRAPDRRAPVPPAVWGTSQRCSQTRQQNCISVTPGCLVTPARNELSSACEDVIDISYTAMDSGKMRQN